MTTKEKAKELIKEFYDMNIQYGQAHHAALTAVRFAMSYKSDNNAELDELYWTIYKMDFFDYKQIDNLR